MTPTADPHVFIEERGTVDGESYVQYRNLDGRRWRVTGTCDRRGDCLIGMRLDGFGIIRTHDDIPRAQQVLGRDRVDSLMDVPVTPEFDSCCGSERFSYVELDPAP